MFGSRDNRKIIYFLSTNHLSSSPNIPAQKCRKEKWTVEWSGARLQTPVSVMSALVPTAPVYFLPKKWKTGQLPPLFLTFKIPSNSPPLVQEEGDVTPKVECMVSNYSPRLSCSRWKHWSGSITPPYPLLPRSDHPPPTTTSPALSSTRLPAPFSFSDPQCQPPTPNTIFHRGLTTRWTPLVLQQSASQRETGGGGGGQ